MSNPAIAALEAEIERREDEIVALREVITMLQGGAPRMVAASGVKALPPPSSSAKAKAPKTKTPKPAGPVTLPGGAELALSGREAEAFELLKDGYTVSVDAMEAIFGEGQKRHQAVFNLKRKLETVGHAITWTKAEGYTMVAA